MVQTRRGSWCVLVAAAALYVPLGCHGLSGDRLDRRELERLHDRIVTYVGDAPCTDDEACAYIAFGSKPCGGPWTYLIYSLSHVDSVTLSEMVSEYNRLEHEFNIKHGIVSDCSVPSPPVPGCADGRCRDAGGPS